MGNETSSGVTGATPASDTPATGTASLGTTPVTKPATMTLEEAIARIAELERHATNKEQEAARHGKNLSTVEKELAAYKEQERLAQEAALSEVEKAAKRAAEAEQQLQQYQKQLLTMHVKLAAQSKDFHNPDLAALAIREEMGELTLGDASMMDAIDKSLDKLAKNNPFLVKEKPAEPPASPAQTAPTPQAPQIPAMNPGRASIAAPGTPPPGRIPRLSDPGVLVPPGTVSKY